MIDINFGCPVKKIVSKGGGSGILKDIPKMIQMTKEVVNSTKLPVTVKTRLGWDENSKFIVDIAEQLQDVGIQALTIHGRTRAQMYNGEADWTLIGEVKNNPRIHIPIIGNGDIDSPEKAKEMFNKYGVDAIMIGRACIGNPWIFREVKHYLKTGKKIPEPDLIEKVTFCKDHMQKSIEWKGDKKGMSEMRQHYSGYFKCVPNFKPTKIKLMNAKSVDELHAIFDELIENSY